MKSCAHRTRARVPEECSASEKGYISISRIESTMGKGGEGRYRSLGSSKMPTSPEIPYASARGGGVPPRGPVSRQVENRIYLITTVAVLLLVLVLVAASVEEDGSPYLKVREDIHILGGNSQYDDDNVTFTGKCCSNSPLIPGSLSLTIVLTTGREMVGTVTCTSWVENDEGSHMSYVFRNVTIPHEGHPKYSLGFEMMLYYRGEVVDEMVYDKIPWGN